MLEYESKAGQADRNECIGCQAGEKETVLAEDFEYDEILKLIPG